MHGPTGRVNFKPASNFDGFVHKIYDGSQMPVTTRRLVI